MASKPLVDDPNGHRPTLGHLVALGLSLAVLTAATQVSIQAFRLYVLGQFIWTTPHFVWMTPFGYMPYFTALAIGAWLMNLAVYRIAALDGTRVSPWHLVALMWFGLLSLSMLFPRLHVVARILLSLGLALQLTSYLIRMGSAWWPRLRTVALTCLAIMLATGLVLHVSGGLRERRVLDAYDAPVDAPNVLIIMLDTVRGMSTSLHGSSRQTTPNLDALAREAVVFDRAYSPAPWTLPSHASLVTGRLPHELSASHLVPLDDEFPTLAERFTSAGFATAAIVANVYYTSRHSGITRGFLHVNDAAIGIDQILWHAQFRQSILALQLHFAAIRVGSPLLTLVGLLRFEWSTFSRFLRHQRRWAPEINAAFLQWADGLNGRPFLALLNYYDAHGPYEPPDGYVSKYDSSGVVRLVDAYEGAISYLDHHLGQLFSALRARGILDNTIVVVTSDHGEEFGEHGIWAHGKSVYPQVTHVPLMVRYPAALPQGRRIDQPTHLCSIGRTVLELTRLDTQSFGRCASLLPVIRGDSNAQNGAVLLEMIPEGPGPGKLGPFTRAVVDDSLHYVKWHDGREELYHHRRDPLAAVDLRNTPEGIQNLEGLRAQLRRMILPPDQANRVTENVLTQREPGPPP